MASKDPRKKYDHESWFYPTACGVNALGSTVKDMVNYDNLNHESGVQITNILFNKMSNGLERKHRPFLLILQQGHVVTSPAPKTQPHWRLLVLALPWVMEAHPAPKLLQMDVTPQEVQDHQTVQWGTGPKEVKLLNPERPPSLCSLNAIVSLGKTCFKHWKSVDLKNIVKK